MNKLTRLKKSLLTVLTLITTTVVPAILVPSVQPAKADLFCWPGERGCKVDGRPGTSGNSVLGSPDSGFIITVVNNTRTTIDVNVTGYRACAGAMCNGKDGVWRRFGAWNFAPGEKALVLNGSDAIIGRTATFEARSRDGRVWKREVDMGSNIGSFTFTFR